ncbi:MAG: hypothetical protein DHS20C11_33400 [Lysobacteraceae bacterium]|nr:MAG: hypothetical protein DHS20C11_33400 [Xanthomonadaceae bacterium]
MFRRFVAPVTIAVALLFGSVASAEGDATDTVTEALKKLLPTATIDGISESVIPGVLEVMVSGQVLYVSEDGKYLMQGTLFDIDNRIDLTDRAMGSVRNARLSKIPEVQKLTYAPENPRYMVSVFTDIDCGYCRRLHDQMAEYNDLGIGISYLFFPRAGLKSHSFDKAVSVWCAADPHQALTDAKAGNEPEPLQCDNPIENHFTTGRSVGVNGTPAIIAPDGTYLSGYVPPAQLLARLDAMSAAENEAE